MKASNVLDVDFFSLNLLKDFPFDDFRLVSKFNSESFKRPAKFIHAIVVTQL